MREVYQKDHEGPWLPGKKGINLTLDEWSIFAAGADALFTQLAKMQPLSQKLTLMETMLQELVPSAGGAGPSTGVGVKADPATATASTPASTPATTEGVDSEWHAELGHNRRVTISYWRNAPYVHCREYYDAGGGVMKPSKKGLGMSVSQWEILSQAMETISTAVDAKDEQCVVELGNHKRCVVKSYQKRLLVDLREWYVGKEGQLSPGAKGIALTPDQWFALVQHAPSVHAKVGTGNG